MRTNIEVRATNTVRVDAVLEVGDVFGRTQGAVFNYTMKGGTNQYHGSAYGALKNEALNSNGFANNYRGVKRQYQRMWNWAASLGGPVFLPKLYNGRNRTFFYAAYERYYERDNRMSAPTVTWPVPDFYNGDFSRLLGVSTGLTDALGRDVTQGAIYDPATFRQLAGGRWVGDMFPGNRIPVSRISKVSTKLNSIASQYYVPQVKDASGQYPLQNNAYSRASSQPSFDQYNFSVKLDHNLNEAHKLSGMCNYTARPRVTVGGLWNERETQGGPLASGQVQDLVSNVARLSHTWIVSPRVLNHATLSYNRLYNPTHGLWSQIDGAAELGIGGLHSTGYPEVNWGGGPYVSLSNPGSTRNNLQAYIGWGVLDSVSFSSGRHFMKAGVDIRRNHENSRPGQTVSLTFSPLATSIPGETFAGTRTGYAFASYLLGTVHSGSMTDPVGIGDRVTYNSAFLQNDFKVSNRLTLQLGLRGEYQPPATEVGNRLASWNPDKLDPASGRKGAYDFAGTCAKCTGRNYFGRKSWLDFGPRVGAAYRISNRFSVRAAYGILYEANLFNYYDGTGTPLNKATATAWGGTYTLTADSVYPAGGIFNWDSVFPGNRYTAAAMDPSWGNTSRPGMIDPDYGLSPYIQQWNVNVQHEIFRKTVIDVGYLANKGTRLRNGALKTLNQIDPKLLQTFGRTLTSAVTSEAQAQTYGIAYPYAGFKGTVASALRAFPQVVSNNTVQVYGAPLGFSTYHSMQITANRQVSNGLSVYSNYVWSKTITNTISSIASNNSAPLDYYNLRLEKGLHEGDSPQSLKVSFFYDLPLARRGAGAWTRAYNAVAAGWNISGVLDYLRGTPVALSANTPLSSAWNGGGNRPNVLAGQLTVDHFDKKGFNLGSTSAASNTFFVKSQFSSPAALTLGAGAKRYAQLRQMGTINEDLVLRKTLLNRERYHWMIRADVQNAFNRSRLSGLNGNPANSLTLCSDSSPTSAATGKSPWSPAQPSKVGQAALSHFPPEQ
jgi:hypothetical protein